MQYCTEVCAHCSYGLLLIDSTWEPRSFLQSVLATFALCMQELVFLGLRRRSPHVCRPSGSTEAAVYSAVHVPLVQHSASPSLIVSRIINGISWSYIGSHWTVNLKIGPRQCHYSFKMLQYTKIENKLHASMKRLNFRNRSVRCSEKRRPQTLSPSAFEGTSATPTKHAEEGWGVSGFRLFCQRPTKSSPKMKE